jgi:putative ABC transport system permease protein
MSIRRFLHRRHWDDERARELDAHLAIETDDNIARGMTADRARALARRKLGNATIVREEIYRMNTIAVVDELWQNLKYGLRGLRLNPGFALVAIVSLALGIGANTAIFQLIDAVRLRTLPVANPQDIAIVELKDPTGARGAFESEYPAFSGPIWERIRDAERSPIEPFAWSPAGFDVSPAGRSRVTEGGLWVSGGYFGVLGIRPAIGRLIAAADDVRGCAPVAVISYAFWQREFGGDPSVVGRTMPIDRHLVDIVGVAERGFPGLEVGRSFDVALPLCAVERFDSGRLAAGTTWWLTVMGRLRPGASVEMATAQLSALSPAIFETVPPNYPPESIAQYQAFSLVAWPSEHGVSQLREEYADSLWILLAIAGIVLVIASANLANLLLARASARQREIAVRLAIGASRGRVVRQFLAESALLAVIGASLGAAIAGTLGQGLIAFLGTDRAAVVLHLDFNWRVFGFTAATAGLCAMLFGLAPAVRATRVPAGDALRTGGRGMTADRHRFLVRRALVVCQLALSLALVVCAFQFVATFRMLASLDAGFRQAGVIEATVDFGSAGIPPDRQASYRRDLLDRIRAIPGVQSAADTMLFPVSGASWSNAVWLDGATRDPERVSNFNTVADGYFTTLGIPVLGGRDFDPLRDVPSSPKVAIVNETFARRFLASGNPIGQGFWVERTPSVPQTHYDVIGLVKDTKYRRLRGELPPIAYLTSLQVTRPSEGAQVVVRSDLPAAELTASIERGLLGVNPNIVVSFRVLQTRIRESLRREQLMAALSGGFGALAALLATIGLYGVLSYTVARRRHEIGIRVALGASRRDIVAMVLREAAWLVVAGVGLGAVLAVAASSAARTLLFGVTPGDPVSLLMAAGCFGLVAAVAAALPALTASRLQPTVAIREE